MSEGKLKISLIRKLLTSLDCVKLCWMRKDTRVDWSNEVGWPQIKFLWKLNTDRLLKKYKCTALNGNFLQKTTKLLNNFKSFKNWMALYWRIFPHSCLSTSMSFISWYIGQSRFALYFLIIALYLTPFILKIAPYLPFIGTHLKTRT